MTNNNDNLAVSVIVPVYNDKSRVKILLERLLHQTLPAADYEIILADNGSTDGSVKLITDYTQSFPGRVRLVSETAIRSSYAARNCAVRVARGQLLAFTDSDCVPALDWLEKALNGMQRAEALCGGGAIEFFFQEPRPNLYEYFDASRKMHQQNYVNQGGFAATANFFADHSLFERYGHFRDDLISGGDYEFGRRLTAAGEKMIYLSEAIVYHPARASFREIWQKSRRVAEGQRELAALGLLQHSPITWQRWLPTLSGAKAPGLSLRERLHYIGMANVIRYTNLWIRRQRK